MYYAESLSSIERSYGCVAEYNRCMEEREACEAEQEREAWDYERKNKALLDQAEKDGTLVYFCDDCIGCEHYRPIGMTSAEDDIEHGICGNLSCKTCEYRKKEKAAETKVFTELSDMLETEKTHYVVVASYGDYTLIYRNTAYEPWVVAYRYDKDALCWAQGHYYADLGNAMAYLYTMVEKLRETALRAAARILEREEKEELAEMLLSAIDR